MARPSSIDRLPEDIRVAVQQAIRDGKTIDEIVALICDLGEVASRSAVGRYTKDYREIAARQRDLSATARAFASEFGDPDDPQMKLLVQLFTSLMTQHVMPLAAGEDAELDGRELHFLARSIKDIASAAKIDTDREAKIREEERKKARHEAAAAAETAGREAGATDETIERIKSKILGLR